MHNQKEEKDCCDEMEIPKTKEVASSCHGVGGDGQSGHSEHSSHGSHGMNHGSAKSFLTRFGMVTILLLPLILGTKLADRALGYSLSMSPFLEFVLLTVILLIGSVFFLHATHELKARKPGMMTLVSIAVVAGYLYSVSAIFLPELGMGFGIEIATLIWVLLFGHYLEAKATATGGDALSAVAELLPQVAHRITANMESDVPISDLNKGDTVRVKPGEKIPADGEVSDGGAHVSEALLTGEAKPIRKERGMQVVAGSIVLDGSLTVRLTRVGEHSTVGEIKKLVQRAQGTKPNSQRIADRAAGFLAYIALAVAIVAGFVWYAIGAPIALSFTVAITVLVIACPHALGVAIPAVTALTTKRASRAGMLIKDLSKLEILKSVDTVLFDKTGTLTEGSFGITEIYHNGDYKDDESISIAASLEAHSSHMIAATFIDEARKRALTIKELGEFENHEGEGVSATLDGVRYYLGTATLLERVGIELSQRKYGLGTIVYLGSEKKHISTFILADKIKGESKLAVSALMKLKVRVAMMTGDNEETARAVGRELGIEQVFAGVMPEGKLEIVRTLQKDGKIVAMVGDGVNDAAALAGANVGLAVGGGTAVAIEAGDMVLMSGNPLLVPRMIALSRVAYSKMRQNLWWALGYNIVAIPLAAGVLAPWGILLPPALGALVMSLSTVIVVINSFTMKKVLIS